MPEGIVNHGNTNQSVRKILPQYSLMQRIFISLKPHQMSALRLIASHCRICMLFAGNDQWAPINHMTDIGKVQTANLLPNSNNISMTYQPSLKHDYVSYDGMSNQVVDWCFQSIVATTALDCHRSIQGSIVRRGKEKVHTIRPRL